MHEMTRGPKLAKLAKIAQVQNDQESIAVRQLGDEEDCDEDGGVDDDHDDDIYIMMKCLCVCL